MSHSSGIPVSTRLRDAFGTAVSGNTRIVKVQIQNEELVPVATKPASRDFNGDLSYVPDLLDIATGVPSYLIVKTDSDTPQFVLLCYVP